MTDIKNLKIQTRKAVTEEGSLWRSGRVGVQTIMEIWQLKGFKGFCGGGVRNEFQNNPRWRLKFVLSTSVLLVSAENGAKNGNDKHHLKSQTGTFVTFPVMSMAKVHHWCLRGPTFSEHLEIRVSHALTHGFQLSCIRPGSWFTCIRTGSWVTCIRPGSWVTCIRSGSHQKFLVFPEVSEVSHLHVM